MTTHKIYEVTPTSTDHKTVAPFSFAILFKTKKNMRSPFEIVCITGDRQSYMAMEFDLKQAMEFVERLCLKHREFLDQDQND